MSRMKVTVAVAPHNRARHKIANILKALLFPVRGVAQPRERAGEAAFSLRTNHDKTLLFQAETVEIATLLDYYPGPDSTEEANREET